MTPPDVGSFPLTSVAKLANVTVAFPGEHWSDRKANAVIVPGEAVVPLNVGGELRMKRATLAEAGSASRRVGIALRPVQVPDVNTRPPGALGPNEIVNRAIQVGEYVHVYYSGAFHLTLVTPDTYLPADLIGWDPAGARPAGKGGTGAWKGRRRRRRSVRGHQAAPRGQRPARGHPHGPVPARPVLAERGTPATWTP